MEEVVYHKFFSTAKSCKYVFKNGKVANFVNGIYLTTIQSEINELTAEIAEGNQFLSIKKDEVTVKSSEADPLSALRAKFFAEFQAEQARALDKDANVSETAPQAKVPVMKVGGMVSTAGLVTAPQSNTGK